MDNLITYTLDEICQRRREKKNLNHIIYTWLDFDDGLGIVTYSQSFISFCFYRRTNADKRKCK